MEKALKALIIERTGEFPPRIHSLPRLTEVAGIAVDEQQLDFMAQLSVYYMQSRYPDEAEALAGAATRANAELVLTTTETLTRWLLSLLKSDAEH